MAKTDTLHIRVEPRVKAIAEKTLNDLGLSITDAINVFLNQVILNQGIPFKIEKPKYNKETLEAIIEAQSIMEEPEDYKAYNDIKTLMEDLNNND